MGLTDEQIVAQLRKEPKFEKWNTTSVSHVAIAATGHNGEPARKMGLELLSRFIEWRRTKHA
jgi:hypothetical protein